MEIEVLASGSKGNCYRISGSSSSLLLEAGVPLKSIRERLDFGLSQAAGCLVSHEHQDHARAVRDLMNAGVDVYATAGTVKALDIESHRLHSVPVKEWFEVEDWEVLAFPTVHDAEESCGFVIRQGDERLLYLTDSAYSPFRFSGLTRMMIECNYDPEILQRNVDSGALEKVVQRRIVRNHMSLPRLKDFLRATDLSNVRAIYLLHLSDGNSDAERFKREIQELTGKPVYVA